jgi:hypothetical protein
MHHYLLELQHLDQLGHNLGRRRRQHPTFEKWHAALLQELPRYNILGLHHRRCFDIYLCQKQ